MECVQVSGASKGAGWEQGPCHAPGPKSNHAWSAVNLASSSGEPAAWALIDSTWAAGATRDSNRTRWVAEYDDVFFLTRPDIFIIDHFPNDSRWALLPEVPTWPQFRDSVAIGACHGWRPTTHPQPHISCSVPAGGSATAAATLRIGLEFYTLERTEVLSIKFVCTSERGLGVRTPAVETQGRGAVVVVALPCARCATGHQRTYSLRIDIAKYSTPSSYCPSTAAYTITATAV